MANFASSVIVSITYIERSHQLGSPGLTWRFSDLELLKKHSCIIFIDSTAFSFKTKKKKMPTCRAIVFKNMNIPTRKRELLELNVFNTR